MEMKKHVTSVFLFARKIFRVVFSSDSLKKFLLVKNHGKFFNTTNRPTQFYSDLNLPHLVSLLDNIFGIKVHFKSFWDFFRDYNDF